MPETNEIVSALQLIRQGQWDAAHEIAQRRRDPAACRIHALLHRMEGDDGNAGYWYGKVNQPFPTVDTSTEIEQLFSEFCDG